MGITVFRSDIKAYKVFLQLLKPALRHLGFSTENWTETSPSFL